MNTSAKLNKLDLVIIVFFLVFFGAYFINYFNPAAHPFEDAAMTLRYAENLAKGHGVVWNIGEKPVDGTTTFLFTVLLAILYKAGISVEFAARLIGLLAHVLTIIIVYTGVRKLHSARWWMAFISAAYFAIVPAMGYIAAYFSTTFFALFVAISWYFAHKLTAQQNISHAHALLFSSSSFILGLIRPEGVFLAIFMLVAVLYMNGIKKSKRILAYFIGIFGLLGGGYLLWRLHYFGDILPNAFYRKGNGIYFRSLLASIKNTVVLTFPFLPAFFLGFYNPKTARRNIFALIPIIGFISIWILLSNEMNYLMRFQYPVLILVLMSWPSLFKNLDDLKLPSFSNLTLRCKATLIFATTALVFGVIIYLHLYYFHYGKIVHNQDGRYDVAKMLNAYSDRSYTIATTEAGLLPFYSKWKAIDTWGLNDTWIARRGVITEGYLDQYKPEIIMMHTTWSPLLTPPDSTPPNTDPEWFSMLITLQRYAEKNKYRLAAAFGRSPFDTHYYYVKKNFPESEEIVKKIRQTNYIWFIDGIKSINYALVNYADKDVK